jgi:FkbH-like protein
MPLDVTRDDDVTTGVLSGARVDDRIRDALRSFVSDGRFEDAWQLLRPALVAGDDTSAWNLARTVLARGAESGWAPAARREARVAVLSTYESSAFVPQLETAFRALGVDADLYAAPYGQVEQEALAADGALKRFSPTHVLIAPTTADLSFSDLAVDAEAELTREVDRWRSLWSALTQTTGARVIQHGFVLPDETPLGHLALRLASSRLSLARELNVRLGLAAGSTVLLIDCERLAGRIGKQTWFSPRLWQVARQPYGFEALTLLARETAGVLAADLGLAARCLVVDLDDTLWGGIVGEEGAEGVVMGEGPQGEAFAAFQQQLLAMARRGVLLAVASKNDSEAAREPFRARPDMRLRLDDFAAFVADWRPKSVQIEDIAQTLGIGLEAIVFADNNEAECAEVAGALPLVDTIHLGDIPSEFVRILDRSVRFQASSLTADDLARRQSYVGRARADDLRHRSATLEDFLRSLDMRARVRRLGPDGIDRAAQLSQKTNQFNLTLIRRTREQVEQLALDPRAICLTLELEDRYATHGMVGVCFVLPSPDDAATGMIDTLLLSCRVIGRTAEHHLLSHVSREAFAGGFTKLRGYYVGGPRNELVADLYQRLGFAPVDSSPSVWEYDLDSGPIKSVYIRDNGE